MNETMQERVVRDNFSKSNGLLLRAEKMIDDEDMIQICIKWRTFHSSVQAVIIRIIELVPFILSSIVSVFSSLKMCRAKEMAYNLKSLFYSPFIFAETIFILMRTVASIFNVDALRGAGVHMDSVRDLQRENKRLQEDLAKFNTLIEIAD